jgi:hypothetical protein
MKSKAVKGLIIAGSAALIALAGAIGGTFALFSRTVDTNTHVKVGNLNFTFERTKLVSHELDDTTGYLVDHTNDTVVDLTTSGTDAIDVSNAAPGAYYTGTFKLKNTGSTAFSVSAAIQNAKVVDANNQDVASSNSVWSHTSVSVQAEGGEAKTMVLNNLSSSPLPDVAKGSSLSFNVKVALDSAIENDGQNTTINFAIVLTAIQAMTPSSTN